MGGDLERGRETVFVEPGSAATLAEARLAVAAIAELGVAEFFA